MKPRLNRVAIGVLLATGLLLALYALAGFLLVPALVERNASGYIEQRLGVPASIGDVKVNPFLLTLDASKLRIGSTQAPLVAAEQLHVDFELSSLFARAWTFAELHVDGLDLRAEIGRDGHLNLADLVPKSDAAHDKSAMPSVVLRHASIRNGQVVFTDRRRSEPAVTTLKPIDIELFDLTTLPDHDGRYTVAATLPDRGQLNWRGTVSLRPLQSSGELQAKGVQAATLWPFVRDSFRLKTPSGTISASTRYTYSSIERKTVLRLDDAAVQVQALTLVPIGSETPLLKLDALETTKASIDLMARAIVLPQLTLRGGEVQVVRNAAGSIELPQGVLAPPAATATKKEPAPRDAPWRYSIATIGLENLRLALRDRGYTPAIAYDATITRATLKGVDSAASAPWQLDAKLALAGGGTASATGSYAQKEKRGEGNIEMSAVPLRPLQPLLARHAALDLKSGSLSGKATVKLDATGDVMRFDARGEFGLADLLVNETSSGDRFLSCKRLAATGMSFDGARNRLVIREIDVLEPGAKLVISKDRKVNLTQVLKNPPAPTTVKAPAQEKATEEKATAAAPPQPPADGARGERREPSPLRITRINLRDGVLDYADQSLVLPFATRITKLNGNVVGIAAGRARPAQVQATGEIAPFGAARVDGSLMPFAPTQFLDLKVRMDNVEMPPLSPYTATFAGRRVAAGKLWLELNYKIVDRQLLGDNNVRISGFVLGERVEAPNALDLPLDLAVALLTDSQGRINIAVPVRGDLNAPRFDLGTVFREALGSLLRRIVTAPFRALGALFGAGEGSDKMATIGFEPGSDELLAPEREKLAQVATALAQRPKLKLVVHGPYAAEQDSKALREQRVRAELVRAGGQDLAPGEKPGPIDFRSRRMQRAIDDLLSKHAGEAASAEFEPRLRDARNITRSDRREAEAQVFQAMYSRIVERYPLPDDAPQQLAARRSEAIRDYMVRSANTPADRIEVGPIRPVAGEGGSTIGTPLELNATGA